MSWRGKVRHSSVVFVLGLTELYSLSDEIHQLFVPGRSFQLMDLGLDLLGGIIGLIIYERFRTKRKQFS